MERPGTPLWSHEQECWVYNNRLYEDPHQAEFLYSKDLLKYCDYLEIKITLLQGIETDPRNHCEKCGANFDGDWICPICYNRPQN